MKGLWAIVVASAACTVSADGPPAGGEPGASTGEASEGNSTGEHPGSSTGPGEGPAADDSGGSVPPPLYDVAAIPDAPAVDDAECSKVDFLFIIDNSSSMEAYQNNLVAAFPEFIEGIQSVLTEASSYQVGVITTDPYGFNVAGCGALSSLVAQTGGSFSSNMTCGPFANGLNFMTESDDLTETFECAARVGVSGSGNEQPMQAMVEAVQRVEGGPGGCNEGFLRDDSLLVIVNIGDENDNSAGTPQSWYDDVVAARGGIASNVVVLSIIDGNEAAAGCGFGASFLRSEFTALWGDTGFEVPICAGDYGPHFMEAVDIIDIACENFVSPAG